MQAGEVTRNSKKGTWAKCAVKEQQDLEIQEMLEQIEEKKKNLFIVTVTTREKSSPEPKQQKQNLLYI